MASVQGILEYQKDPEEDFYAILGCDENSTRCTSSLPDCRLIVGAISNAPKSNPNGIKTDEDRNKPNNADSNR
ncbi:unnamed protein product [Nezara viridula]|uniref:Uncharacterized protein n=1 Tax=Nezara viridula TaxID=85310 RepID=A0A9P0MX16_NEZVI|nr:unnamed protein product [Nezara viridula]